MFEKCKRILLKPWRKWRTKRFLSQAKKVSVMPETIIKVIKDEMDFMEQAKTHPELFKKMFESIPTVKVVDGMVKGDVEMLENFKKELE